MKILVRHSPSRAVYATVEETSTGLRLLAVWPKDGPPPEVAHLVGQIFPDRRALRRALVAAMKDMVGDTLDHVLLSRTAYAQWETLAQKAVREALAQGIALSPDAIPDEMAKPRPDGGLLIWVDLPSGRRVELVVPKGHWAWRKRPS